MVTNRKAFVYINGHLLTGANHIDLTEEAYNRGIIDSEWNATGVFGYILIDFDGQTVVDIYSDFQEGLQNKELYATAIAAIKKHIHVDEVTYGPPNDIREELTNYSSYDILSSVDYDLSQLNALVKADPAASVASDLLQRAGGRVFVVGGAVRDVLLGKDPKDIDLMVTGLDESAIKNALKGAGYVGLTGKDFGVFRFAPGSKADDVEIAMPRTEVSTGAGHKDFKVQVSPDIAVEEDLSRRDFSANAIAYDIENGKLIDPFGGADDIKSGTLRAINDNSLKEDPLRTVRALVAYARHGLKPDEFTMDQMRQNGSAIRHLPGERLQMELDKLLLSNNPAEAFELAHESGVLDYLLPEVSNAMDVDQKNGFHDLTVGNHILQVLRHMTQISSDPDLRLAALLHDIGKPDSMWTDEDGHGHFYKKINPDGSSEGEQHEELGADMTRSVMKRLKYSNDRIDRVTDLVSKHMFPYFNSPKGARRFQAFAGDERTADDLMKLREADAHGKSDGNINEFDANQLMAGHSLLDQERQNQNAFSKKDLTINGTDIINLGIPAGPQIGQILDDVMEQVIENPAANERNTLLQYVKEHYAAPGP